MNRISVQPGGPDRRVPVENLRGTYFQQGVAREVYLTPYIQKCLTNGDLVVSPAAAALSAAAPAPVPAPPAPPAQSNQIAAAEAALSVAEAALKGAN